MTRIPEDVPVFWLPERSRRIYLTTARWYESHNGPLGNWVHVDIPGSSETSYTPSAYVLKTDELIPPTEGNPIILARCNGAGKLRQYKISAERRLTAAGVRFGVLTFEDYSSCIEKLLDISNG